MSDAALVYTVDDLDPFKDAPKLPDTQPAVPALDTDKMYETSTFEDDLRIHRGEQENDFPPRRQNGYSYSHGGLLSAQARLIINCIISSPEAYHHRIHRL